MPRGKRYEKPEIILCTYIAKFGRDTFNERNIYEWCLRSRPLGSIKMKVRNIAAMLNEEGYSHHSSITAPLSGRPSGQQGRRTNWDIVRNLVNLSERQHRNECLKIFALTKSPTKESTNFKQVLRREFLDLIRNVFYGLTTTSIWYFWLKPEDRRDAKPRRIPLTAVTVRAQRTSTARIGVRLEKGPKFDGMQPA